MTSRHEELTGLLPDYAHGMLPEDIATDIKAHMEGCPECAMELDFIMALGEAPVPEPLPGFSTRLVARVLESAKPKPSPWRAWWSLPQPAYAFGALASAVIALSVMYGSEPLRGPASAPQVQEEAAATVDPLSYEPLDYGAINSEVLNIAVGEYAQGYDANGDGLLWLTDQELDALDRELGQALEVRGQKI